VKGISDDDARKLSDHGFTGQEIAWLDQNLEDRPQEFDLKLDSDSINTIRQIVNTENRIAITEDSIARDILQQKIMHLEDNLGEQTTATAWWKAMIVRENFVKDQVEALTRQGMTIDQAIADIQMTIDAFYKQDRDATPWTFLRAEYRKSLAQAVSDHVDYMAKAQEMAKRKTGKLYE